MIRLLLLLLLLVGCAPAVDVSERALSPEEVQASIGEWSAMVAEGRAAVDVYFNLGHAYYAKGDPATAAGFWRVSHELSPRNGAISHNLAMVRTELSEASEPVPPLVPWGELLTPDELGFLGLILVLLGLFSIRLDRRRLALGLLLAGLLLGLQAVMARSSLLEQPIGVCLRDGLQLRELPRLGSRLLGPLGLGSELRILQVDGPFALVLDGKERRGWVPLQELQVPARH